MCCSCVQNLQQLFKPLYGFGMLAKRKKKLMVHVCKASNLDSTLQFITLQVAHHCLTEIITLRLTYYSGQHLSANCYCKYFLITTFVWKGKFPMTGFIVCFMVAGQIHTALTYITGTAPKLQNIRRRNNLLFKSWQDKAGVSVFAFQNRLARRHCGRLSVMQQAH